MFAREDFTSPRVLSRVGSATAAGATGDAEFNAEPAMRDQMYSLQRPASLSNSAATASAEFLQVAASLRLTLPPADLCERLLAAVEKAASESASSMDALRVAVAEFTVTLKNEGATPEAVLITLKTLINNRAFPLVDPRARGNNDPLRQKISTWSIEEFFKEQTI